MPIEKFQFYRATITFCESLRSLPGKPDLCSLDIWFVIEDYRHMVDNINRVTPDIRYAFEYIVTEVRGRIAAWFDPRLTTCLTCSINSVCTRIENYVDEFTGYSIRRYHRV